MGSLNDYGRDAIYSKRRGPRLRGRLLRQCALAAVFFCAVAALVSSDGPLGEAARYVAGPGLAAESSWLTLPDDLLAVNAAPDAESPGTESPGTESPGTESPGTESLGDAGPAASPADPAAPDTQPAPEGEETPQFTAPASGVVVSDLAVSAGGEAAPQGILIQGSPGQRVRAAGAGSVISLSSENGLYRLEIGHAAGFTSIYQGLSQIDVTVGDRVELGDPVGSCAGGELDFSLLRQGQAVDPLEYLFN